MLQAFQTQDPDDYLLFGVLDNALLPFTALFRTRSVGTWTDFNPERSIPITVYNAGVAGDSLPVHTWEDPRATGSGATSNTASRFTTFVRKLSGKMLGYCEATAELNDALNANPTFAVDTSSWRPPTARSPGRARRHTAASPSPG